MGFKYGRSSASKLATCHPTLAEMARRALDFSPYDITIVHGWRGREVQNALYDCGASSKPWPDSTHNHVDSEGRPSSLAIDFAPWINGSIPWQETHVFAIIAGCFFAAAADAGARVRYGGDWDMDGNTHEHKLQDWGHIEISLEWD